MTDRACSVCAAEDHSPRSLAATIALALVALALFAGFIALGIWQIERRSWKLDLMARVEQRVHAPPVAAPAPDAWPQVSATRDEYRHVRITGTYLHDRETLVQASTELGAGYWVLTPLQMSDGSVVLVNRGFVATERRERSTRIAAEPRGEVVVTGLLRMPEGQTALLRRNDPAADRWYSRDVQAIGMARGLPRIAPYFIDADAALHGAGDDGAQPTGGLTVIAFRNDHLVYAITWLTLSAMVAAGAAQMLCTHRRERSSRTAR